MSAADHFGPSERRLLDEAPNGVVVFDRSYTIKFWNSAMERTSHLRREQVLGRSIFSIAPDLSQEKYRHRLATLFSIGAPVVFSSELHTFFIPIRLPNGQFRRQLTTITRMDRADGSYALATIQDVTVLRQQIEDLRRLRFMAERAKEAKSVFMASVSHELRTPMNGVLGMSQLLLETELNDQQREFAEGIRKSAEALLTVVNDVLDYSKIEAGKFAVNLRPFSLTDLVKQIEQLFNLPVQTKGLSFSATVDQRIPPRLITDDHRLRQILVNLIGNAVKFTHQEDSIGLRCDLLSHDEQNYRVRFCVSDTGLGIHPASIQRIFDAFNQESNRTSREYGGTGLGLSICDQLVRLLGGSQIYVSSEQGIGSTFSFTLPLKIGRETQLNTENAKITESAPTSPALRILVAEDNEVNQKLIGAILKKEGHTVTLASDGEQAIKALGQQQFDIVFMDINMPKMDGVAATRAIRAQDRFKNIPIVALTAEADSDGISRFTAIGMNSVVTKPYGREALRRAIAQHCSTPAK